MYCLFLDYCLACCRGYYIGVVDMSIPQENTTSGVGGTKPVVLPELFTEGPLLKCGSYQLLECSIQVDVA